MPLPRRANPAREHHLLPCYGPRTGHGLQAFELSAGDSRREARCNLVGGNLLPCGTGQHDWRLSVEARMG